MRVRARTHTCEYARNCAHTRGGGIFIALARLSIGQVTHALPPVAPPARAHARAAEGSETGHSTETTDRELYGCYIICLIEAHHLRLVCAAY